MVFINLNEEAEYKRGVAWPWRCNNFERAQKLIANGSFACTLICRVWVGLQHGPGSPPTHS